MSENFNLPVSLEDIKNTVSSVLPNCSPLFLNISGSHAYGFPSADSDIDVRGCYYYDKSVIMGYTKSSQLTIENSELSINNIQIDLVTHELCKYSNLICTGDNGTVLEQIFSPFIAYQSDDFENFKEVVEKHYLCKKLYKHYESFAKTKIEAFRNTDNYSVKDLLYALRVLHTGIYLFKTNKIILNLSELNEELFKHSYISDLIEKKTSENEKINLDEEEFAFYSSELDTLLVNLEEAYNETSLPENVRNSYIINRVVSGIYQSKTFEKRLSVPIVKNIDDKHFAKQASRKHIIESNPFSDMESICNIKLHPTIVGFLPNFTRFLFLHQNNYKGEFYQFILVEDFLNKIKSSCPYYIFALMNSEAKVKNQILQNLATVKDVILTEKLYKAIQNMVKCLKEKIKDENENDTIKYSLILTGVLLKSINLFKKFSTEVDYQKHSSVIEKIKDSLITEKDLFDFYQNLEEKLASAYKNANISIETASEETLNSTIKEIKESVWLFQYD